MNLFKRLSKRLSMQTRAAITTTPLRRRTLFYFMSAVLCLTSFVMTVVNLITAEYVLMTVTLVFSLLCLGNILFLRLTGIKERHVYRLFGLEAMVLLAFFIVSGIPDGFSVLWIALIPSFALLVFGLRLGSIFSAAAFVMVVALFWLPWGQSILRYAYSEVFMLRFPFFYVCAYLLSLAIEYVRSETQKQLENARREYDYLYRHDALTGLYNRYGINEFFERMYQGKDGEHASVILFDIDGFKSVNDTYGHEAGDEVLRSISAIPRRIMCEQCSFCRWGGEEFLFLMSCTHDPSAIAEMLRREIENTPTFYRDAEIRVTASFGVCSCDNLQGRSIHELIEEADRAMYESKSKGKNCVTMHRI